MTDYERLVKYGWKHMFKASRWDLYGKMVKGVKWEVYVPTSTYLEMTFIRNGKRFSPAGVTASQRGYK